MYFRTFNWVVNFSRVSKNAKIWFLVSSFGVDEDPSEGSLGLVAGSQAPDLVLGSLDWQLRSSSMAPRTCTHVAMRRTRAPRPSCRTSRRRTPARARSPSCATASSRSKRSTPDSRTLIFRGVRREGRVRAATRPLSSAAGRTGCVQQETLSYSGTRGRHEAHQI